MFLYFMINWFGCEKTAPNLAMVSNHWSLHGSMCVTCYDGAKTRTLQILPQRDEIKSNDFIKLRLISHLPQKPVVVK